MSVANALTTLGSGAALASGAAIQYVAGDADDHQGDEDHRGDGERDHQKALPRNGSMRPA